MHIATDGDYSSFKGCLAEAAKDEFPGNCSSLLAVPGDQKDPVFHILVEPAS
jgi:hypothetical protein